MIEKFHTFEEAALFAEDRKSEGYNAVILNEGTGFLWGSPLASGFRVMVSDHPIPDEAILESEELNDGGNESFSTRLIRSGVVAFLAIGALGAIVSALASPVITLKLISGIVFGFAFIVFGGYFIFRTKDAETPNDP